MAREDAARVADDVYEWGYAQGRNRESYLQGGVGVASTTRASDVAARVFDPTFHKHLDQFLEYKALRRDGHGIHQRPYWGDRAYTLGGPITHAVEEDAYVAVRCDVGGVVGVYFREHIQDGTIDELMAWWAFGAWQTAIATQVFLGGAEDYFASLVINGRGLKDAPRRPQRIPVTRGPLPLSRRHGRFDFLSFSREAESHLASVRRDVLRAVGRPAHETALPRDSDDPIWHIHYDPDGQQSEWSPGHARSDLAIGRRRGRRRS